MLSRIQRYRIISLATLSLVSANPALAATYTVTDLGAGFEPQAISNNAFIVGMDTSVTPPRAVYHQASTLTTLETSATATGVNQSLFISGYKINVPDNNQARLWRKSQALGDLNSYSNMLQASDVNDYEEIVGTRLIGGFKRPYIYDYTLGKLDSLSTLGGAEAWANAVNNVGQITGSAHDEDGSPMLYIYDHADGFKNLKTLAGFSGSEGTDINDTADTVGWAFTGTANALGKRAVLSPLGIGLINLDTLEHDTDSVARGVNNSDLVVGQSTRADGTSRAFLYDLAKTDLLVVTTDPNNPNRVYTSSVRDNGIFISNASGNNWDGINRGLLRKTIYSIAINPDDPSELFAGGQGGIYRSTNGGNLWTYLTPEMDAKRITVYILHLHSSIPNLIFAGTNAGMYISEDRGETWTLFRRKDSEANEDIIEIFDFVETPSDPNRMYAATEDGVFRIDIEGSGFDWSPQNGDGATKLLRDFVLDLAIPPATQEILYAGLSGGGVASASLLDGFLRWTARNEGLEGSIVNALAFASDDTLYAGTNAGLSVSTNLGRSWTTIDSFGSNRQVYTMAISRDAITQLYVATSDGSVLRSDNAEGADLGESWATVTRGIDPPDVFDIASLDDDPNTTKTNESELYLAVSSGIYRRAATGGAWLAADDSVKNIKVISTAIDPSTTPKTILAASPDRGIFRSTDGGAAWSQVNIGLGHWSVRDLAIDSTLSPSIAYAATMGGTYRSEDGGRIWTTAYAGLRGAPTLSLYLDTSVTPYALYTGTNDGVYRSADRGSNWVPINAGMENIAVTSLIKDTSAAVIYAASTSGGLYYSSNNGVSWDNINTNNAPTLLDDDIFTLALDSTTSPSTLYVGTPSGIFKSTVDDLGNWIEANGSNNEINFSVYTLAANVTYTHFDSTTTQSTTLYAGTDNNAIYKSTDGGDSWIKDDVGLSDAVTNIQDLTAIVDNPDWVFHDATAISHSGHIIGRGEYNGEAHGFLLTPAAGVSSIDLEVTQTSTPEAVKKNTPIVFQIIIKNIGEDVATDVTLLNWLPARATFRYAGTNNGVCLRSGETVRCELQTIPAGDAFQVNISVEPEENDITLLNVARVTANEQDINFDNNTTTLESGQLQVDRCFIATAAYGSFLHPHVTELRYFRDQYLLTNDIGRAFVERYYQYSPSLARLISEDEILRISTQALLAPIVYSIRYPFILMLALLLFLAWRFRERAFKSQQ